MEKNIPNKKILAVMIVIFILLFSYVAYTIIKNKKDKNMTDTNQTQTQQQKFLFRVLLNLRCTSKDLILKQTMTQLKSTMRLET